ncbi:hypothetical protein [Actinoplanes subtropicus]|uniref:hypothetical protein n=1 Tax=Actinoplanes subtropicus TaxID=543632 RepID=UPI000ABDA9A9|nr:hypothetical protein [Actinoplanes subtropicus]
MAGELSWRRVGLAVAGVVAAAGAVAVVATHIDQPDVDSQVRAVTTYVPLLTAPGVPLWTPPPATDLWTPPPATAVWTTPPTPPTTSPPAAVPVGGVLPPDGSVRMRGDSGEEMTVRVVRIANPAPPRDPDNPNAPTIEPELGHRLVTVDIGIENTGGVPFLDDLEKYTWLVDRAGRTYPHDILMTRARQLHVASRLDPESWNGRTIVFDVQGSVELTRFRLSLHPNSARQTQDWRLG